MSRNFSPTLASSFMVSGLSLKSLIHFELIFVSDIRQGSSFTLLCMNIHLSQHHLLKKLCFTLHILSSLVKYYLTIYIWVYFWTQSCIPLVHLSVCMLVTNWFDYYSFIVQLEIRKCHASHFVLSQDCFGYSGSFVVPYKFEDCFIYFCKKCSWNLNRNCIQSIYGFGQYGHFNY